MDTIKIAATDAEILQCLPVLRQLQEHLVDRTFVADFRRLESSGYQLVYLMHDGAVQSVAGFRVGESFGWRRYLYVHDFVTDSQSRSQGHGAKLMAWLMNRAREHGCNSLHLDSRVTRYASHRFYLKEGMIISGHHFCVEIGKTA